MPLIELSRNYRLRDIVHSLYFTNIGDCKRRDPRHRVRCEQMSEQRRTDSRASILEAAAKLFYERGYAQTSIRAIASGAGIKSSSLYFHFQSKDDILYAVQEEAFHRLTEHVKAAIESFSDPWDRITSASVTHLSQVLQNREFITITTRELPQDQSGDQRLRFTELRDDYEEIFRNLINELPLAPGVSRKYLRLTLIGALAGALVWYREGRDTPEEIGLSIVNIVRFGSDSRGSKRSTESSMSDPIRQNAPRLLS